MSIKKIVLTMGEPAGVGPDVLVRALQRSWPAALVVAGDPAVLSARAQQSQLPLTLHHYDEGMSQTVLPVLPAGEAYCYAIPVEAPVQAGVLNLNNVPTVLKSLHYAGQGCLRREFDAVVTAPVHKGIINESGVLFSGHTEFFAQLAQVAYVVMLLITPAMKVALVTTHLPLKDVAAAITSERLIQTLHIVRAGLENQFELKNPCIAVCGLNPHAGEGGYLGREEIDVIQPVLDTLRQAGWNLRGPVPADTVFLEPSDAILAMYHDQGLPLIKYTGFQQAVNMTLGLPFVRTSPDHGTALALAGTKRVDAGSMMAAIQWAIGHE
ncbi:MAG: 4-hydroxythreonine-4-phosphate dehydrogenase PdxA [Gammaproteobacteria bacterium]|nr:4-hydroxythreonine-4-phosphate dehydrogenase PdxA [Gammaproteobacteria bacterium]